MADNTKIEWADATWNPLRAVRSLGPNGVDGTRVGWHCEHVSEGCRNCYAELFNERRLGTGLPYKPGHRADVQHILNEKMLRAPLRRRKPTRYFLSSMTDVFGAWVSDDQLDRLFAVMALAPQHTFMVLTKRPERMLEYLRDPATPVRIASILLEKSDRQWGVVPGTVLLALDFRSVESAPEFIKTPLPNVWLGTSVEDQRTRTRLLDLAATPAAVRFMSGEPLLEGVTLNDIPMGEPDQDGRQWLFDALTGEQYFRDDLGFDVVGDGPEMHPLDWVITGGESGPGARPMHPGWARSLRDQCAAAGVAFHFKQWGEFVPCITEDTGDGLACLPDGGDSLDFEKDARHPIITAHGREFWRIGKARAGRLLDGRTHDDYPGSVANG